MPKHVLALTHQDSDWNDLLVEFFEDVPTHPNICSNVQAFNEQFDQKTPDLVFVEKNHISLSLTQKLKALKKSSPTFAYFALSSTDQTFEADGYFDSPESLTGFQKELMSRVTFPEKLTLQVVDDEPEIGRMMQDYFQDKKEPQFEVRYASNGRLGLKAVQEAQPDALILDVKMPEMTGIEVYRELCKSDLKFPVIVFFDAITGNEVTELHESGHPIIVDKGSEQSSMPEMFSLIKKAIYFT